MKNQGNNKQSFADFEQVMKNFEERKELVDKPELSNARVAYLNDLNEKLDDAKKQWHELRSQDAEVNMMEKLKETINDLQNKIFNAEIDHAEYMMSSYKDKIKGYLDEFENGDLTNAQRLSNDNAIISCEYKDMRCREMLASHKRRMFADVKIDDSMATLKSTKRTVEGEIAETEKKFAEIIELTRKQYNAFYNVQNDVDITRPMFVESKEKLREGLHELQMKRDWLVRINKSINALEPENHAQIQEGKQFMNELDFRIRQKDDVLYIVSNAPGEVTLLRPKRRHADTGVKLDVMQNQGPAFEVMRNQGSTFEVIKNHANTFVQSAVDNIGSKLQSVKDAIKNAIDAVKNMLSR